MFQMKVCQYENSTRDSSSSQNDLLNFQAMIKEKDAELNKEKLSNYIFIEKIEKCLVSACKSVFTQAEESSPALLYNKFQYPADEREIPTKINGSNDNNINTSCGNYFSSPINYQACIIHTGKNVHCNRMMNLQSINSPFSRRFLLRKQKRVEQNGLFSLTNSGSRVKGKIMNPFRSGIFKNIQKSNIDKTGINHLRRFDDSISCLSIE
jgi:hypothetical protein